MLQGLIRFHDADLGTVDYTVYGVDSFTDLRLYLINEYVADVASYENASSVLDKHVIPVGDNVSTFLANKKSVDIPFWVDKAKSGVLEKTKDGSGYIAYPYQDLNPSMRRRLDIKKSNKYASNITNRDFCTKVSALVRYALTNSKMNYNQNFDLTDSNYFDTQRVVQVENAGYVKYDTGLIKELNLKSKYVEIILRELPNGETPIEAGFGQLKREDKYGNILSITPIENIGFRLNEETLGFHYETDIAKRDDASMAFGMYQTLEEVIEANPDKNLDWLNGRQYHIVNDDNLEETIEYFNNFDGFVAYDTETTGLKINFLSRNGQSAHADVLVGVVLSVRKGEGFYFPLQHKAFPNLCNGDHNFFMEKYMRPILERKKIIVHNLVFDWKVSYVYDINVNCVYDTQLAFGVTKRYEDPTFKVGLKVLTKLLFGIDTLDLSDFVSGSSFGNSDITFADLPYDLVKSYAPADTDWTLALFEYLEHHDILGKYDARRVFEIEMNFAKVVAYSEFYGYGVNVPNIPKLTEDILRDVKENETKMFNLVGYEFNPSSPPQLQKVLFEDMGIEAKDKKRSTKKELLNQYGEEENIDGTKRYPVIQYLLNYRNSEKLYSNFLKKLDLYATPEGFIFPNVFQLGTDTGRTTSKEPNYQSYNNPVKKNIVPRKGFIHFDCDFSQIEYRVLASLAKQDQLMKDFEDPDLDYHTYQASRMFSIPYSLVSKDLRGQSKGINFGLPFGMGDASLGARIFGERTNETRSKATALRRKFFAGQEKIEMFFEYTRSEGVRNNFTSTAFGRRRYYDRSKFDEQAIRRQAGNHVIQGTAADIYKQSVNRLFNRCVAEGWLGKVLFNVFVHDELLTEVSEEINLYYFFKAWREEFELVIDGFCPLYAGAGVGMSWYEAKSQDLPQQYITEVINQYEPDMKWHGDGKKFINDLNKNFEKYKAQRVIDFVTAPENQGQIIKPVIYSLLVEMSNKALEEFHKAPNVAELIAGVQENLSDKSLVGVTALQDEKGKKKLHKIKLLKDYLALFAYKYNLNLENMNVLSSEESPSTKSNEPVELPPLVFEDNGPTTGDLVDLRGYCLDSDEGVLYLDNLKLVFNNQESDVINYLFQLGIFQHSGAYRIAVWDKESNKPVLYNAYIEAKSYTQVVQLFVQLKSSLVGSRA